MAKKSRKRKNIQFKLDNESLGLTNHLAGGKSLSASVSVPQGDHGNLASVAPRTHSKRFQESNQRPRPSEFQIKGVDRPPNTSSALESHQSALRDLRQSYFKNNPKIYSRDPQNAFSSIESDLSSASIGASTRIDSDHGRPNWEKQTPIWQKRFNEIFSKGPGMNARLEPASTTGPSPLKLSNKQSSWEERARHVQADKTTKLEDLKAFAKSFKIPTHIFPNPHPLPIPAHDNAKQETLNAQQTERVHGLEARDEAKQNMLEKQEATPIVDSTNSETAGKDPLHSLEAQDWIVVPPSLMNDPEDSVLSGKDSSETARECGLESANHIVYLSGHTLPFHPIRELGTGSMGFVDEVRVAHHKPFVRKRIDLRKWDLEELDRTQRIVRNEVDVMKRLSHRHIVRTIGSYEVETRIQAILMFPVGDNNLRDFLFELERDSETVTIPHRQRLRDLRKWLGCLASAITYIHAEGVQHEDIKPSNIICRGSDVFLTDFSSCRQFKVDETTSTWATARATLIYKAPELFQSGEAGKHGKGTDIFALGCVFMEMEIVSKAAFKKTSPDVLMWSIKLFRAYCKGAHVNNIGSGSDFAYCKSLKKIHNWPVWTESDDGDVSRTIWETVIRPMLALNRAKRPSAATVLQSVKSIAPGQPTCVCFK